MAIFDQLDLETFVKSDKEMNFRWKQLMIFILFRVGERLIRNFHCEALSFNKTLVVGEIFDEIRLEHLIKTLIWIGINLNKELFWEKF